MGSALVQMLQFDTHLVQYVVFSSSEGQSMSRFEHRVATVHAIAKRVAILVSKDPASAMPST
jgi:hypothetical protein